MRVNSGADWQAVVMGGDLHGEVGTAVATSATTLQLQAGGVSHGTNDLAGHRIVALAAGAVVEATIVSNTSGTGCTVTVDQWSVPGLTTAGSTPGGTSNYAILSGGSPGVYLALNTNSGAPSATDTMVDTGAFTTDELKNAGGGLIRARATYSHTPGAASYTLTNTWTANGNDPASSQVNKVGVSNSPKSGTGILIFETAVPSPPTLVSGDTIQITETINI